MVLVGTLPGQGQAKGKVTHTTGSTLNMKRPQEACLSSDKIGLSVFCRGFLSIKVGDRCSDWLHIINLEIISLILKNFQEQHSYCLCFLIICKIK